MKRLAIGIVLAISLVLCSAWGFYAHKRINQLAIFTLPADMFGFYKKANTYIVEHAVDPDKRRYIDSLEAHRHYIDIEEYASNIDSIPRTYQAALEKYGERKLRACGIVPWQIQRTYFNLVSAFRLHDSIKILKYSADLGHYIGDAHVPLHTTKNHNGQFTNQHGIHAFWESRIPELFAKNYDLLTEKATYIAQPLQTAWAIVKQSHLMLDSVLQIEANLNKTFPSDQKYSFANRGAMVTKQYALAYAHAYQEKLNGMIEKRMRAAILAIGSFWYSAWIDAGQPKLRNLVKLPIDSTEHKWVKQTEQKYQEGKILGREY